MSLRMEATLSDQPWPGPAASVLMHFTKSSAMHRRRIDWLGRGGGRELGSLNHEECRDEMTLFQGVTAPPPLHMIFP